MRDCAREQWSATPPINNKQQQTAALPLPAINTKQNTRIAIKDKVILKLTMDKKQKEKTPARRRSSRNTANDIEIQNDEYDNILTLEDGSVATTDILDAEYAVNTEKSLDTRIEVRDVLPTDYRSPSDDEGNNIAVTIGSRDPLRLEEPRSLHITGKFKKQ